MNLTTNKDKIETAARLRGVIEGITHIDGMEIHPKYRHSLHLVWFRNSFIESYCEKCIAKFDGGKVVTACLGDAPRRLRLLRIIRGYLYMAASWVDSKILKLSVPTGYNRV